VDGVAFGVAVADEEVVVLACAETSCEMNTTNKAIKVIDAEAILPQGLLKRC